MMSRGTCLLVIAGLLAPLVRRSRSVMPDRWPGTRLSWPWEGERESADPRSPRSYRRRARGAPHERVRLSHRCLSYSGRSKPMPLGPTRPPVRAVLLLTVDPCATTSVSPPSPPASGRSTAGLVPVVAPAAVLPPRANPAAIAATTSRFVTFAFIGDLLAVTAAWVPVRWPSIGHTLMLPRPAKAHISRFG
jgi:hypothetical protein